MFNNSLNAILYYFKHFENIDYITFTWFGIVAFLFLILGILLVKKYPTFAVIIIIVSLLSGAVGPFFIKWYINSAIRKSEFILKEAKQLNFTDTFIINGTIKNNSKKNFSTCRVYIGFYKLSKNKIKNYINNLRPAKTYIKTVKKPLKMGEQTDVRIVLENFKAAKDLNISGISECYK